MDNNFDKLFKTKVEQQHFDYNPKEWESFLKKQASNSAGKSKWFSSNLFIASMIIGVAVSSVVTYFVFTNYSENRVEYCQKYVSIDLSTINSTKSNNSIVQNNSETHQNNPQIKANNSIVNNNYSASEFIPNQTEKNRKTSLPEKPESNITKSELNSDINESPKNNTVAEKPIEKISLPITQIEQKNISETTPQNSNLNIKSTSKSIETNSPITNNNNKSETVTLNPTEEKIINTELKVNNVSNETENKVSVTPKKYAYEDYTVVGGEAKQKANFSFAQLKRSIDNYLSISHIGLERSRDIASYLNNHFLNDPSLSGFENRYTLSAICQVGAILQSIENSKIAPYEYTIGNSFPIHSKNMGIGIAFNQIHGGTYNSILLNLSLAYQATINRNSSVLFGGGINLKSIDRIEVPLLDYPWGSLSPQLLRNENQSTSLNLGVRYLYKTLYASISATNVYNFAFTGDYHKSISPLSLRLSSGGKLRLNQTWSLNPSFTYQYTPYSTSTYFVPYISLSKLNKLYFGIHSENFQSIGAHIGYRAANSINIFLRSGASLNKSLRDAYGIIHYGEIGFRIELGNYQK